MAELVFDRVTGSTPYDRQQELTEWRPVDTVPAAVEGERFPSRAFTLGGYRSVDAAQEFLGLVGMSVHAVMAPDYVAMTGAGRRAIAYRGHGGPTAGEYWAWGVEIERVVDDIVVYVVHQDALGAFVTQTVAQFPIVDTWLALAVSRETIGDSFEARAWLNGQEIGSSTLVAATVATPGEPVTLGMRLVAAETSERQFLGTMERVLVSGTASTDAQVRYEYNFLRGGYDDAYGRVAAYKPRQALDTAKTSAYGRYRVRPLAEMQSVLDAGAERSREAMLLPGAYGPHLGAYEAGLDLRPSATDSIAQRQESARATLAGSLDLSPGALQELAAQLFGVVPGDVAILEGANYFDFTLTGTGELSGPPWRIRGPVDVTSEVGGLTIHVPAGRDLRYSPIPERSIFIELGIHHRPVAGAVAREEDHGLAIIVESAAGLSVDTWFGFHYATPSGEIRWVAHDGTGFATRTWTVSGGLSAWSALASPVAFPVEMVVEWVADTSLPGGQWHLRYRAPGSGPGNWMTVALPVLVSDDRSWLGFGVSSSLSATAGDVDVLISQAIFKAGDAPSAFYWQAYDSDPVYRDIVPHSRELDRKGRAVSQGSATYELVALADTDGAAIDYTPTLISSARLAHIGDDTAQAAQMTGIFPTHLWAMQESASPVYDRASAADLTDTGTPPTFQAAGPVDRLAVEFAASANDLQAASASTLDVTDDDAVIFCCILRVSAGTGVILGKERTGTDGWVLTRAVGSLVLRVGDGVGSATATLADGASGFVVDTWFALVGMVESTGGGNARVVLATSQGSATGTGATVVTNSGNFTLGAGQSGNSVVHRTRWVQATLGGEANGRTPSDIAATAARLAAATGVA